MGCLTNLLIQFYMMISSVVGMILPEDKQLFAENESWRFVIGFPMIVLTIQLVLCWKVFKWEPVDFSIRKGNDADALDMIAKIYRLENNEEYLEMRRK